LLERIRGGRLVGDYFLTFLLVLVSSPQKFSSSITLPGRKVWTGGFETAFLEREVGFLFF